MLLMRHGAAVGLFMGLGALASRSEAATPARACIEAHAQGQVERDGGRLLAASERFRECAADACPALIRQECRELGAALAAQTPSIVVRAEDDQGRPLAGARATLDETRALPSLDGTALPVDPGVHQVEVTLPDGRRQTVNLSVADGQKAQPALARFDSPVARRVATGEHTLAYVIGGAGILGLGAWGAFAWDGRRRQSDLETCAPRCEDASQVDVMRRSYLIADVLMGLSLAALGTSAYLLITNSAEEGREEQAVVVGARGRF